MALFGSFALLLALALSVYCVLAGIAALWGSGPGFARVGETARRAGIAAFIACTAAAAALVVAVFSNDFSLAYIVRHSNRDLPGAYKFSALWSGQEGSLLFWAWLLAGYGFLVRLRHKVDKRLFAYASVIIAAVQVFFFLLLNVAAKPFTLTQGQIPADGNGLNPLLQYPEMVIHPPMLYLGYVGFTVPFAFALGALLMRYPGEKWIHITRRWTMVTWLFLTCGIALGGHWAYSVLGWGGYWGWDPVENASLLPWITGTAFLHSVMMQEKRGMMKKWNIWLIFITFFLCVFGTFLTRSGVVSSVHAFAQSGIGPWFINWIPPFGFLGIIAITCFVAYFMNREHLRTEHKLEAVLSRESSFLFNNLVLLVSCFAVFWGTMFPVLSEWVQGTKVTVGPPFFNRVNIPIGLFLLLLTAVGPLLAWRKTSFESLKRNFTWPTMAAVLTVVALIGGGMRPWQDASYFYSLMAIALSVLVAATIASEFWRGARVISGHSGLNMAAAMVHLTRRNTRRYGGYIVHFGVVVMVVGFAGAAFNQETEKELGFGQEMSIGRYRLVSRSYTQDDNPNHFAQSAVVDVYNRDRLLGTMYPAQYRYKSSNQTGTIVAIRSSLREDLYLVLAGLSPETDNPIIKAHLNPLVVWVWVGFYVLVFGTLVALLPNAPALKGRASPPAQPAQGREATPREAQVTEKVEVGD
jgi:cytochrome c-type biogenesis protein CcmF